MARVCLLHWNREEGDRRRRQLEVSGHSVHLLGTAAPSLLAELSARAPDALLIDLTRLPSHGREVALAVRRRKSTRTIPLFFVGGPKEKVNRIRVLLPDAVYCRWEDLAGRIDGERLEPNEDPVVPDSVFSAYAGRPLAGKLGVKEGSVVCLLGAPEGFEHSLGKLPANARVTRGPTAKPDLVVWFPASCRELKEGLGRALDVAGDRPIWLAWPKKTSGVRTDLTQQRVRELGLSAGLVDYKICSMDSTWSGLLFRKRKDGFSLPGDREGSG